jgi:xanthine dehydrogenase accessory factor
VRPDLLQLAAALARADETFAMAIVVRREPASSAQVGNMALVRGDGTLHGWLGGSCIHPAVVRAALEAIAGGSSTLISLSPDPSAETRTGVKPLPITCHSGGTVDIYVEPVLPSPRLVVFGVSPVAQAIARLGKAMGYAVDAVDPEADAATFPDADRVLPAASPATFAPTRTTPATSASKPRLFAIVATMGERDEESLASALALGPVYVGLVASRRRFAQVRETLAARGVTAADLDRVRSPAGLDIGATAPEEVALSILAEIVQVRRAASVNAAVTEPPPAPAPVALEALDPVCGMTVVVARARHVAEVGGETYYFCCGGCREKFLAAPARYRPPAALNV